MAGFHSSKQALPFPFLESLKEDLLFQDGMSSTYMTTLWSQVSGMLPNGEDQVHEDTYRLVQITTGVCLCSKEPFKSQKRG